MLRKLLVAAGLVVGVGVAALVLTAVGARYADGPVFVFPGGPLESGERVPHASIDWAALAHVREVEFQLETPARSRTTWFIVWNGTPYIPCGFCTNELLKRWPRDLESDDRVVLRVAGKRIAGRAHRVPHASEEFFAVADASSAKYRGSSDAQERAEARAASLVSGAVDLAESAVDPVSEDDGADYWLYRVGPR